MREEEVWERIPAWDQANPEMSFNLLMDDIDGRIPVTRIEDWRQFSELLESPFFNRPRVDLVFRGHRRFDWSLSPTLGRVLPSGIVKKEIAEQQLSLFRKAIRGRIEDHSLLTDESEDENDELWSIGQHHGLMTPLLDWTHSPYVALFFAFTKGDREAESPNPYRAIYVLNKSFVADKRLCPAVRMFEPRKDDHGRLVSQAGLFTFSPYDSTIEDEISNILFSDDFPDDELRNADGESEAFILAKYVCKIYVRNRGQKDCIRHLRRMNVHHASLFPDLLGAADYCNVAITEAVDESVDATPELRDVFASTSEAAQVLDVRLGGLPSLDQMASRHNFKPFEGSRNLDVVQIAPPSDEAVQILAAAVQPDLREVSDVATEATRVEGASIDNTNQVDLIGGVRSLLLLPVESREVDPGRLEVLAGDLAEVLKNGKQIDWQERDSLKAGMLSRVRVLLRNFGYPLPAREFVLQNILKVGEPEESAA